ncbi:lipase [Tsukamurella asaccharolytica]|uniref:Lipase n=1 Tax=Tsukamurella asaccharolytica TaxID=2592067 RepID=A0A5C5RB82_9ACTN|nr:lipase family protein [Tsukamurella asaccharolytica]TWS19381.1 lipase [Tsukamurella asaccharolytica]
MRIQVTPPVRGRRALLAALVAVLIAAVGVTPARAVPTPSPRPTPGQPAAPTTPSPPAEPSTPGLDKVFNGYVLGTFATARLGSPEEIFTALTKTDPFYREPALRPSDVPGTLLKAMKVDVMFLGVKPGKLQAWRTMYVTTGIDGTTRKISTGIVMIPETGPRAADKSIIGYQQANDSVGAGCHPSTQWTGRNPLDGASWSALGPLALMLGQGDAVAISDVGNDADPKPHGVFAGKFAGHALLDGVRAAQSLRDAGLSKDARVGLFGIAGGGVGAATAALAAQKYAPELNIRATVLQGMVVDQRTFMEMSSGSLGAGFAFATLLGLEPEYPEMKVNEQLNPAGRALADVFRSQCQDIYFLTPLVPLGVLFANGKPPSQQPTFQRAFDDNDLLRREGPGPSSPVLIASCAKDDSSMSLVPAADARKLADKWRASGTDVTYRPTDCSMTKMITDIYGWGTDLFGMQTVVWLHDRLAR